MAGLFIKIAIVITIIIEINSDCDCISIAYEKKVVTIHMMATT